MVLIIMRRNWPKWKTSKGRGYSHDFAYIIAYQIRLIMPDANPIHLKLIFESSNCRLLEPKLLGKGNVTKRTDVIATMISMKGNLRT